MSQKKHIAILGSTGSIGQQALEVIRQHTNIFEVELLTANNNADLLIQQALDFKPNAVVIVDEKKYGYVKESLKNEAVKVFAGCDALDQAVQMDDINIVLTSMVGFSGLKPTLSAIDARKTIALANKETLVVAGDLITKHAKEKGVNIYPVDSEHSAIFQCLQGEWQNPVEKIYLTASGGPFRGKTKEQLQRVTKADALNHPNWKMGAKITIDSATLMNKGLEVIEAKWLFNLQSEQIDVIIHPQSIIHSLVQFKDGSMKAQIGLPDMKLPILYALSHPDRVETAFPRFDFLKYPSLTFETPDSSSFPNLALSYEALRKGGNMPCIMNAANEIAVQAFLDGKVSFLGMHEIIEYTMDHSSFILHPTLSDYIETDHEARQIAGERV
jgi:1-deoxy-D-xylulose-5-phosphate reductoisomerase